MKLLELIEYKNDETNVDMSYLNEDVAKSVLDFHKSIPKYEETPLVNLDNLSKEIGLKGFFVKDESYRFGLNAFKVLGGSYCIGKYIAQEADLKPEDIKFAKLTSKDVKDKTGEIYFTTAKSCEMNK